MMCCGQSLGTWKYDYDIKATEVMSFLSLKNDSVKIELIFY